jgi:talin
MEVEFKKKHRQLKVKLLDDTVKTFLVDGSSNVYQITDVVGSRMGIKNPEEFSLKKEASNDWLNPAMSLEEQGVSEEEVLLLKKKFFFNDANVDRSDPIQLHLLYVQVRANSILMWRSINILLSGFSA